MCIGGLGFWFGNWGIGYIEGSAWVWPALLIYIFIFGFSDDINESKRHLSKIQR